MFHKWQNSLSRYFASEGIVLGDIASGDKIDKTANCLAGNGRAGLEKNKCRRAVRAGSLGAVWDIAFRNSRVWIGRVTLTKRGG